MNPPWSIYFLRRQMFPAAFSAQKGPLAAPWVPRPTAHAVLLQKIRDRENLETCGRKLPFGRENYDTVIITWRLTSQCGKCTWKASKHVLSGWFKPNQIICRRTIPKLMPHAWTELVWMKWYHAHFHMELQHTTTLACMWLLIKIISPGKSLFFANQQLLSWHMCFNKRQTL